MEMTPELAGKILRASEQECWLHGWDKGAAIDYVYTLGNKDVKLLLEENKRLRESWEKVIADVMSDGRLPIWVTEILVERIKKHEVDV